MKKLWALLIFIQLAVLSYAQPTGSKVYMFAYFKGSGADGLHLAYSYNGLKWQALRNDSSSLKPMGGQDTLMRDPCIVRDGKGIYHMVWTLSWKEKGILNISFYRKCRIPGDVLLKPFVRTWGTQGGNFK